MRTLLRALAIAGLPGLLLLHPPEARAVAGSNSIGSVFWVISPEWATQLPPSGSVNAPGRIQGLSPDQEIAVGITATGPDRDAVLSGCTLRVSLNAGGAKMEEKDIQPTTVRRLKAESADATLSILDAAGLSASDKERVENLASRVSIAVFPVDWIGPPVNRSSEVQIKAVLRTKAVRAPAFDPEMLHLRPWSEWAAEKNLNGGELASFLSRYHDDLQPGLLLPLLRSSVAMGTLRSAAATEYFALAFDGHPAAREAALESLDFMDVRTRFSLLLALRSAGEDIGGYARALPPAAQAALGKVVPLADPRSALDIGDPASGETVYSASTAMDRCWGAWMATGDPAYLRSVVELLGGAADYQELVAAAHSKDGAGALTIRAARGLLYKVAGWSIASFDRTDPRVADWIRYWRTDPGFPANLKRELDGLHTNPAFRQR